MWWYGPAFAIQSPTVTVDVTLTWNIDGQKSPVSTDVALTWNNRVTDDHLVDDLDNQIIDDNGNDLCTDLLVDTLLQKDCVFLWTTLDHETSRFRNNSEQIL